MHSQRIYEPYALGSAWHCGSNVAGQHRTKVLADQCGVVNCGLRHIGLFLRRATSQLLRVKRSSPFVPAAAERFGISRSKTTRTCLHLDREFLLTTACPSRSLTDPAPVSSTCSCWRSRSAISGMPMRCAWQHLTDFPKEDLGAAPAAIRM